MEKETDWIYYMDTNPNNIENARINKYQNEFNYCFNIFLNECKLSKNKITDIIQNNKKFIINLNENDIINNNSLYQIKFFKSKFIVNHKFIKTLREYYNSIGYFIKGPIEINEKIWEFEFFLCNNHFI